MSEWCEHLTYVSPELEQEIKLVEKMREEDELSERTWERMAFKAISQEIETRNMRRLLIQQASIPAQDLSKDSTELQKEMNLLHQMREEDLAEARMMHSNALKRVREEIEARHKRRETSQDFLVNVRNNSGQGPDDNIAILETIRLGTAQSQASTLTDSRGHAHQEECVEPASVRSTGVQSQSPGQGSTPPHAMQTLDSPLTLPSDQRSQPVQRSTGQLSTQMSAIAYEAPRSLEQMGLAFHQGSQASIEVEFPMESVMPLQTMTQTTNQTAQALTHGSQASTMQVCYQMTPEIAFATTSDEILQQLTLHVSDVGTLDKRYMPLNILHQEALQELRKYLEKNKVDVINPLPVISTIPGNPVCCRLALQSTSSSSGPVFVAESKACCFCRAMRCFCIQLAYGVPWPYIAPLPQELRQGKQPAELGYWILDESLSQKSPPRICETIDLDA